MRKIIIAPTNYHALLRKRLLGVDVFIFTLMNHGGSYRQCNGYGIYPGRGPNCGHYNYSESALTGFVKPNYESGQYAAAVILYRNGWKFPDNYPLKFWR